MEIISNVNVVQKDKIFNSDVFIKEGKIHNIKPHKKVVIKSLMVRLFNARND